jgi:hypothetical protein
MKFMVKTLEKPVKILVTGLGLRLIIDRFGFKSTGKSWIALFSKFRLLSHSFFSLSGSGLCDKFY